MIWLTWRQFRTQAAVMLAAVAALAATLAGTGPQLADLYRAAGSGLVDQVSSSDQTLYYAGLMAVLAVPAVIAMFWGAPLISRELETGTHYLAWNQGVTRTRWLATKLGLGAAAAMAAAGLTSLAVSWWSSPIDRAVNGGGSTDTYFPRLDPVAFAARGVAPMSHAAFAFVLGVALGLLIRRTLPAMATTFALYAAVQVVVPMWVRPHLAATDRTTVPIEPGGAPISVQDGAEQIIAHLEEVPGTWVTSQQTLNAAGQPAAVPSSFGDCLSTESGPPTLQQVDGCIADLGAQGYKQQVTYQPAGNFWALQWAETALYLGLALALAGLCAWWIRRRLT
ncbi:transporter [Streptomyces sp. Je 1-79]|uniref:ABC transporter permease subunit n=1 Tax=Streptomyces sp. Je 1-79 TaxID=2943847 RepID=UPI0021A4B903|nr:ABC transporter permease subunit [Streptomyces sp. Je 1-79]MCT4353785.1 transporter [Streptomyces sp. Je 1-79]